jgi:hypothetical protein
VPEPGGARATPIRVAVATRDARFLRLATFLLSRSGFDICSMRRLSELVERVDRGDVDVALLDGSDSAHAAARALAAIDARRADVGALVVADRPEPLPGLDTPVLPKWSAFSRLVGEIEHAYARRQTMSFADGSL